MTNIKLVSITTALALGLVGCGKPSNVPRMQEDAEMLVKRAQPQLADLEHRIAQIQLRGRSLPTTTAGYQMASTTIGAASSTVNKLKGELSLQNARIANAAKTSADDLQRLTDELHTRIRTDLTVATADITTVESWIAQSEYQPRAGATTPATDAAPPVPAHP